MFSGGNIQRIELYSEADNDKDDKREELEIVDFNDVGKLFGQMKKRKEKSASSKKSSIEMVKNQFMEAHLILPSPTPSLHTLLILPAVLD